MKLTTILLAGALVACQNTTFNGVKMNGESAAWGLALVSVAAAAFYLNESEESAPTKQACKRYVSAPPGKDQNIGQICAIPLDQH